ncbi:E3 ubiquitin-protein ligase AIRP2 [Glycine soja]|uniref:E3 ubiquitin-protein ligase AIRP2 n=1 Tax=Glycine soja TaxID=3848 RepID=A0A445I6S5_GLYSO|nr:E3 ubiquitin-protein ligase AIRP2 [Glycine soja]
MIHFWRASPGAAVKLCLGDLLVMGSNPETASLHMQGRTISQSCPFCRDSLKRVNSGDLWVFTDRRDVVDMATVTRENLRRLFMYIDKLPLIVPDSLFDTYDSHIR